MFICLQYYVDGKHQPTTPHGLLLGLKSSRPASHTLDHHFLLLSLLVLEEDVKSSNVMTLFSISSILSFQFHSWVSNLCCLCIKLWIKSNHTKTCILAPFAKLRLFFPYLSHVLFHFLLFITKHRKQINQIPTQQPGLSLLYAVHNFRLGSDIFSKQIHNLQEKKKKKLKIKIKYG